MHFPNPASLVSHTRLTLSFIYRKREERRGGKAKARRGFLRRRRRPRRRGTKLHPGRCEAIEKRSGTTRGESIPAETWDSTLLKICCEFGQDISFHVFFVPLLATYDLQFGVILCASRATQHHADRCASSKLAHLHVCHHVARIAPRKTAASTASLLVVKL